MKQLYRLFSLVLALAFLAGCAGVPGTVVSSPAAVTPVSVGTLPPPIVAVTSAPDPLSIMRTFLDAWKKDDYASMYALLSQDSKNAINETDFSERYRNAMAALTLQEMTYDISDAGYTPSPAQFSFKVTFKTRLTGDFKRDLNAPLTLENGQWRIAWDDSLIMPELKGGNHLQMDFNVPARGIINDRAGQPLVAQTDVMALGVIPVQILPDSEGALLGELSILTGLYPGNISAMYADKRSVDWYVPIGEAPLKDVNGHYGTLAALGGVVMTQYNSRFYYQGGIAPQTVGYVSPVPKEQLDQYLRNGYSPAARVGMTGIEKWGEPYLAGKTGGTLYVIGPDGKVISTLGQSESKPASSITLTLDENLQAQAQKAITGFRGSIVVMERNTGRILAMASSPRYDPNLFEPENANSVYALGDLLNDQNTPLLDRAVQGQYPLGSVFKVITFSAALESGTYTPESPLNCGYEFKELADRTLYDWTYEHFQTELRETGEGRTRPSGDVTLSTALMRSCNPYFWHIGKDLYDQGRITAIADMARGFGLGSKTGIEQINEASGTIINPPTLLDAVNQAIGQGDVLVTPLQVADFMAAIGNGGTLYRPQIVEKIIDSNGVETNMYKAEVRGVLPVKAETLAALQSAMLSVIRNPRGTAYNRFTNLTSVVIYGKTGTAESNTGTPHAWFAGYTDSQRPDLPDIAIAVVAENAGEGSSIAAPMFKRMVETYFFGQPRSPYWWESNIGITRTPTSPVTPTPGQ